MLVNRNGIEFNVADTKMYADFWQWNNWETSTYENVQMFSNPEKIFIDIGAWIGPISLFAAQLNKMCYAIEPDPVAYNELETNINLNNFNNINTYNLAISNQNGTVKLGSESLGNSMTRLIHTENCFKIQACTTSKFLTEQSIKEENISLIKIDTEGSEIEILKDEFFKYTNVPIHLSIHGPFFTNKEGEDVIRNFVNRYANKIGTVEFDSFYSVMLYN